MVSSKGPLTGLKIVEMAGLGPGPLAGTILSDFGADIVRVVRKGARDPLSWEVDARGRRAIELDLKDSTSVETVLRLIEKSEVFYEGFRPGVMERLGLGPDVAHARNPALIYARMTGWG